jgi:hypothetical protein
MVIVCGGSFRALEHKIVSDLSYVQLIVHDLSISYVYLQKERRRPYRGAGMAVADVA